ncbi:MAG: RDD family protein [Lysobacterales bacterium]
MQVTSGQQDHEPTRHCGLPRRLLAMVYDALIVIALLIVAGFLALPFTQLDTRAGEDLVYSVFVLLVWAAYFVYCWVRMGATPGMRAWRVRLIGSDGAHPGAAACVLRFGVAMLSGLALGAGFFWALFDARRRCWHDLASGSELIVEKRRSDRTP